MVSSLPYIEVKCFLLRAILLMIWTGFVLWETELKGGILCAVVMDKMCID